MSAYNEVIRDVQEVCPRCSSKIRRSVQFKYGDTWQHTFALGDRIEWGANDVGEPGHAVVVVVGYPGECPICGNVPDNTYDVTIRQDVIDRVRLSDGTYDYARSGRTFFVVEP